MQGLINILKPTGLTSSDVVVRVRGILRHHTGNRLKVGHLGTLDPGAAGVLPIAIGKATRLFDILTNKNKKYRAAITFGKETDTLDSYGIVTSESTNIPKLNDIEDTIKQFIGNIEQVPPQYSAINIAGKRAYQLARSGIEVELKSRRIVINSIDVIDSYHNTFVLDIDCQGGTYIRSLVRDIANSLNSKAYMSYLIRLSCHNMDICDSVTLEEFSNSINLIPTDDIISDMPRYDIDTLYRDRLTNGVKIDSQDNMPNKQFRLYIDNELFGITHVECNRLVIDIRL